jgi:hypothetical protein
MQTHPTRPTTANFKAQALTVDDLRAQAPSVFSPGPMAGLSARYAFVPTSEILQALGERGWVPVNIEQQHVRLESRFGFQKHLIRLRRAEQMQSLDEWNAELVLTNSHDALCAYVLRVWIFRRICSNGLVVSDEAFSTIRFRHASLKAEQVVQASHQIIEFVPRLGALIDRFRNRQLDFAAQALVLRYSSVEQAPIEPRTLLESRRIEDEASDLWTTTNRVGENLLRGGLSDSRRDRRGRIRTFGSLRSIDSKVSLNTGLWSLAEQIAANEAAVRADRAYIRQLRAAGFFPGAYYPHNLHFLWWAQLLEGRSRAALKTAQQAANFALDNYCGPSKAVEAPLLRHLPCLTLARFGRWKELLEIPAPASTNDFLVDRAVWHFTRGPGIARARRRRNPRKVRARCHPRHRGTQATKQPRFPRGRYSRCRCPVARRQSRRRRRRPERSNRAAGKGRRRWGRLAQHATVLLAHSGPARTRLGVSRGCRIHACRESVPRGPSALPPTDLPSQGTPLSASQRRSWKDGWLHPAIGLTYSVTNRRGWAAPLLPPTTRPVWKSSMARKCSSHLQEIRNLRFKQLKRLSSDGPQGGGCVRGLTG